MLLPNNTLVSTGLWRNIKYILSYSFENALLVSFVEQKDVFYFGTPFLQEEKSVSEFIAHNVADLRPKRPSVNVHYEVGEGNRRSHS